MQSGLLSWYFACITGLFHIIGSCIEYAIYMYIGSYMSYILQLLDRQITHNI